MWWAGGDNGVDRMIFKILIQKSDGWPLPEDPRIGDKQVPADPT